MLKCVCFNVWIVHELDCITSVAACTVQHERSWKRRVHLGDGVDCIILKWFLHFICGFGLNSSVLGRSSRYIQTTCHCSHTVTCLLSVSVAGFTSLRLSRPLCWSQGLRWHFTEAVLQCETCQGALPFGSRKPLDKQYVESQQWSFTPFAMSTVINSSSLDAP
jgi:hypothetical protein